MVTYYSLISSQILTHVKISCVDAYLKCRLFFQKIQGRPLEPVILAGPSRILMQMARRPHCKKPFFTRLGFM